MAKCRFPGKALKLNTRKRIKFNWDSEQNPDELRVLQIRAGLLLFKRLFGDSEEEDEFDGFSTCEPPRNDGRCCTANSNQNNNVGKSLLTQKTKNKKVKKIAEVERENEKEENEAKHKIDLCSELVKPPLSSFERRLSRSCFKEKQVGISEEESQVIASTKKDLHADELSERLIIKRKKLLMKEKEKASKKFVLPTVSVHSSRVIKPNMRIFTDMSTPNCSSSTADVEEGKEKSNKISINLKPSAKFGSQNLHSDSPELEEEIEKDPVCRSITLYTDAITEQFKGPVGRGRPPKKLSRTNESQGQEELSVASDSLSPVRGAKEEKVKEKIEKLLRSPWDERLKQTNSVQVSIKEPDIGVSSASKTILRKARLNLNNTTLQKLRSPSSIQRLIPASETDSKSRKCGLCQDASYKTVICYGVSCCETCQLTVNCFIEGTFSSLVCQGGQGECQLVGLSPNERCEACWLSKILATCAMPNILHDNLRKQLPAVIRDKVPTSLARSFNVNSVTRGDDIAEENKNNFCGENLAHGTFGSLIDLPGGWKRRSGREIIVISPSGEKFRSVTKLDEYLKRQGINAEASVLFGNLQQNKNSKVNSKHKSKHHKLVNKSNNVVVTTLPGGWSRCIKWRHSGDKFDTYVCSPDGRTFHTSKDLCAYFQRIGKVDDMNKYFPVISSPPSYSENSEASTMEPFSEASEISTDMSVVESESDKEITYKKKVGESVEDEQSNLLIKSDDTGAGGLGISSHNCEFSGKSSTVIISNFANTILTNSCKFPVSDSKELCSTSNSYANFDNDDAKSVSSISDSFQGDSSAIDLNFLSDGRIDEGLDMNFKFKTFDELESERSDMKIPINLTNSEILDLLKDHSKHKHKKHKKRRKSIAPAKNMTVRMMLANIILILLGTLIMNVFCNVLMKMLNQTILPKISHVKHLIQTIIKLILCLPEISMKPVNLKLIMAVPGL